MIGKIKDFIYNFNDVLVVLLIVALAGGIVIWRVDEIMAYPEYLAQQQRITERTEDIDFSGIDLTPVEVDDFNGAPEEIDTGVLETEQPPVEGTESGNDSNGSESSSGAGSGSMVSEEVRFTVPSGSSADRIADLLKQADLIPSQSEFLKIVTDNGLDKKLQAGTFTIPAGSTMLDIAKIIARQM